MSKGPSPRVDQVRALREARFARNVAREKEAEKPVKAEKPAAAATSAPAEEPAAAANSAPTKRAKRTLVKKAKKKPEKTKKPGK